MRRIRVLQIGKYYHPYVGGTESHLFTLLKDLRKEADVEVLAANTALRTVKENIEGIDICRMARLANIFSLPLTPGLPLWLKKKEADILHFHLPNPLSVISYFLSRPKGKVIVSYHSDIIRQRILNPLFEPLLMRFLKNAETIIVSSDNLVKNSRILNKFKDKCRVIPHGIDIKRFKPDKNILQKASEARRKHGSPLLLFVGRLVYYKGLEYLLKAMQDIEAKLLIVGEGPWKNRLQKLSRHLGVDNKTIWMGKIEEENLVSYYYACDVFVLPSSIRTESFGIVQLEAFACGKPVVSTDLPTGVPFVNQDKKTGLIVPPRDSEALAKAINKLLASSELRSCYGQNGKERVEKEFRKEWMADKVLKVYKGIV